ncbi:MAG: hypothetical protein Q4E69_04435 [Bacilli bacterium]|nr:hypothetical protein [Bacilli bacterium]
MKRNFPIYLLCFGLLLIFSGAVTIFIYNLRADQATVLKRMGDVGDVFEDFSTDVSIFEEERDSLYSEVLSNLYYDNMYVTDEPVKERLTKYENLVKDIEKYCTSLDKLCSDVYYPDSSINSKCSNYKSIYEQVVNYFVTDINFYNKSINDYNDYIKDVNSAAKIKNFETKYKYVDYNGDGKKDGSEE